MWTFLAEILKWLQSQASARGTRTQQAVMCLQAAALQTNLHDSNLKRGGSRDVVREGELAVLWSAAAGAFYRLDPDLAERFQLKSEYWTMPEAWTADQISGAGISLERITELTRQLLREG